MRLLIVGCLLVGGLMTVMPVAGQAGVELMPFECPEYEIAGVTPAGWAELRSCIFFRQASDTDRTALWIQVSPHQTVAQQQAELKPNFKWETWPAPDSQFQTEAFDWQLWSGEMTVQSGDVLGFAVALAASDRGVVQVVLQTSVDEYATLHDAVFMPVVEELAPVVVPYRAEAVTFDNGPVTLAGTLTLPPGEGPFPAVVLISVSGPNDRDESLLPISPMRPFRLLADAFTREGMAVLRYDDRGIGASTGVFEDASRADLVADAAAAFAYLQSRADIAQIGLLGHSEGGLLAAMIAADNPGVAFVISMAGPALSEYASLEIQTRRVGAADGLSPEEIDAKVALVQAYYDWALAGDWDALRDSLYEERVAQYAGLTAEQQANLPTIDAAVDQALAIYQTPWFAHDATYDPVDAWSQVTCPVLALFGELDVQVPAEANRPVLADALAAAGNSEVTIITLAGANHLFQAANTGSMLEYARLELTFMPEFLDTVIPWLHDHVGIGAAGS